MKTNAQQFYGERDDIDAILKSKADFSINFINGNFKEVAGRYTNDGKLFPTESEIIEGLKNIEDYWTYGDNVKILRHEITPLEIRVIDGYAHVYGTFVSETLTVEGPKTYRHGKYVNIWRKEGGSWKVYLEIWNLRS